MLGPWQPRPVVGYVVVATLFFALGNAILVIPLGLVPSWLALASTGFDVALLGVAVAMWDAFDEGQALRADMLRSFVATGEPGRYKVLSRDIAYHGTSMGALAITGLADIKHPFEPLVPGGVRVPNTNFYRAPGLRGRGRGGVRPVGRGRDRAGDPARGPGVGRRGLPRAGAELRRLLPAAARVLPAGPGDLRPVRRAAGLRRGDLRVRPARLLLRLPAVRATSRTSSPSPRASTSGYSPLGGMMVSDALMEPFDAGTATFLHGVTFAGHPVSCAVALANLDIFEKEDLLGNVRANEAAFRATLEKLYDLPIVGDVRGAGYFYGIEMVKDKATRETFTRRGVRAAAARLPVPGAVRRRAGLPGRRPRRPGHPAGPAAHLRPGALRRDRADPARRADRGLDAHLRLLG